MRLLGLSGYTVSVIGLLGYRLLLLSPSSLLLECVILIIIIIIIIIVNINNDGQTHTLVLLWLLYMITGLGIGLVSIGKCAC
jgi:hypothetical protein